MAMPLRQTVRVGSYLLKQRMLKRREKFPLIVEPEPLYACNLACEGCGRIQHPAGVLKQRMPVAQAVGAYGRGKEPRCANCMAHCGYEPTAVLAAMGSLREPLRAARETVAPNRG